MANPFVADMKIHHLDGHMQAIYLVAYTDKLLLLDGACKPDAEYILTYITATLKRPTTDLKLVVITHFHPDHAGAARALKAATGCAIASRKLDRHWYGGMSGLLAFVIDVYLAGWVSAKMKRPKKNLWFNPLITPDVVLHDGDHLPNFTDWQVVASQGHTDRDISVYHAASKQVYVADLFIKTRHGFITPFPVYLPCEYKASLERVWALGAVRYMLAHGGVVVLSEADKDTLRRRAPKRPHTIKHQAIKRLAKLKLMRH